jgi:hypothetical protein
MPLVVVALIAGTIALACIAGLREACRRHAYVNVVYRQERADRPAWVQAIAYVGGREIVSGEAVARRQRSNVVAGAVLGGVLAGVAVGVLTMTLWARRRRERPARGGAPVTAGRRIDPGRE